jgi:hypothetical protein
MKPGRSSVAITMLISLFVAIPASARTQSGTAVKASTTSGSGEFHRCYKEFLVFDTTCAVHHVDLPKRIGVGDYINLEYGSNPKRYAFHVGQIIQQEDGGCTVRRDSRASAHGAGKIVIDSGQPATRRALGSSPER